LLEYKAGAVGAGRTKALEYFENEYKEGLDKEAAMGMALSALQVATETKLSGASVEIGVVTFDTKFVRLTVEDVEARVQKSQA
jgi:proteasome alpha subunit